MCISLKDDTLQARESQAVSKNLTKSVSAAWSVRDEAVFFFFLSLKCLALVVSAGAGLYTPLLYPFEVCECPFQVIAALCVNSVSLHQFRCLCYAPVVVSCDRACPRRT